MVGRTIPGAPPRRKKIARGGGSTAISIVVRAILIVDGTHGLTAISPCSPDDGKSAGNDLTCGS
ncbi:MAG TPA: hypothetical protein VFQ39_15465 [Longimicrobium sp.]|nr:hypothetical protein [Longimicrobium sp.]